LYFSTVYLSNVDLNIYTIADLQFLLLCIVVVYILHMAAVLCKGWLQKRLKWHSPTLNLTRELCFFSFMIGVLSD